MVSPRSLESSEIVFDSFRDGTTLEPRMMSLYMYSTGGSHEGSIRHKVVNEISFSNIHIGLVRSYCLSFKKKSLKFDEEFCHE